MPATIVILIGLFMIQRYGTERIGKFFGPVMVVWFAVIALAGLVHVGRNPVVLLALKIVEWVVVESLRDFAISIR